MPCSRIAFCRSLAAATAFAASTAAAHHNWTQANRPDPDMLGLYHIEGVTTQPGTFHLAAEGFAASRQLEILPPAGGDPNLEVVSFRAQGNTGRLCLDPHALKFNGRQELRSVGTVTDDLGDATIEAWFRWPVSITSSSLALGTSGGPRLHLQIDTTRAGNDRFGILGADGEYRPAPAFQDWGEWSSEFAYMEQEDAGWGNIGVCIHSTGIEPPANGCVDCYGTYKPGSYAIFFFNDHVVGTVTSVNPPYPGLKTDLAGLKVRMEGRRLSIASLGGANVYVDEFTFWTRDLTNDGNQVFDRFDNGRGSGVPPARTAAADWNLFE